MLKSFLYLQKNSEQDNGHSLDLDQRRDVWLFYQWR